MCSGLFHGRILHTQMRVCHSVSRDSPAVCWHVAFPSWRRSPSTVLESVWYQRDEAHSEFWDVLFFWTDGAKTKLSLEVDYDVSHQQLTHFAGESVVQKMNQNTTREFVSHIKTLLEP